MQLKTRMAGQEPSIKIACDIPPPGAEILSPEALALVADLHRRFNGRRLELLEARIARQKELDTGAQPDFLAATAKVRESDWCIAEIPDDLVDRRVEITGPVDRKMIINALNSPAKAFMADFEDSCSPTWSNIVLGQANLRDPSNTINGAAINGSNTGRIGRWSKRPLASWTSSVAIRPGHP